MVPNSDAAFRRELITELRAQGGLNCYFQKILLWYYLPTASLPGKIVMQTAISKEGDSQGQFSERPLSLRFNNIAQIRSLIAALEKCLLRLGKAHSDIRPDNFDYQLQQELIMINDIWRGRQ